MGIEYRLTLPRTDRDAVAKALRTLPETETDRPEVTIKIEGDSVYFCDHLGGGGRAIFGQLIARLASSFEQVIITEL
jgi:hypothetical protein